MELSKTISSNIILVTSRSSQQKSFSSTTKAALGQSEQWTPNLVYIRLMINDRREKNTLKFCQLIVMVFTNGTVFKGTGVN